MKRDRLLTIRLPSASGVQEFPVHEPKAFEKPAKPFTRKALAAAHVVADPLSAKDPWLEAAIDWDATLAYRRHLEARPNENAGEAEAEYWITRRLMVEGILGDRGVSGVDLLWRKRY
jgi:hypothetical protein